MIDYQSARLNMVESQIRPNKVTDLAVLDALLAVPREIFLPEHLRGIAYVDEDIPLGGGRYLMEPMVLGRLLQSAAIAPTDIVLEIACSLGYATAILARLARNVVALEEDGALAPRASAMLARLGAGNAAVVEGPLVAGYPHRAPYDVILVGGAVGAIPPAIAGQLAEGGRLLAVVAAGPGLGKAVLMTRSEGVLSQRILFDAGTPLLPGFAPRPGFVF